MTKMESGTKVFVAGSRRLSRLNGAVKRRIDNIVDKGLTIIVGDANGADKAVQQYLGVSHYDNVIVFCMEDGCRNNLGNWPTRRIAAAEPLRRDFAYYSSKDRAMAQEADYGLMLWDGQSRGTLRNILDLVRHGKPVVVYIAPKKAFCTVVRPDQLAQMLDHLHPAALHGFDRELQAVAKCGRPGPRTRTAPLF